MPPLIARLILIPTLLLPGFMSVARALDGPEQSAPWYLAVEQGEHDRAVALANASPLQSSLGQLLKQAQAANLAEHPQWRAFLHYEFRRNGSWQSQVDAEHFFLSEHGKHDPEAELAATLAALYSDKPEPPLRLTAYCRFVARRYWLQDMLPEMQTLLPQRHCPEYERYVDYLDAHSLTLIFPTAHPNSPSSAFGHTLLRIDKKDQRAESRLLNMSINFAAEVPEGVSGAAYAINGLSGGFPGRFRMLPYHMKLREYGQIENRDTWEYPLTLSPEAVTLVLRHAYEMLISHFDYFFFSENCSYHLLSLLQVADPENPLTEDFDLWTIPIDTIRLLRKRGLVKPARFTGSSIRLLRARRAQMNDGDATLALAGFNEGLDAIEAPLSRLPAERQAAVLDLMADYERYERLKHNPGAQGGSPRERSILSRRSKLGIPSQRPELPSPALAPDAGHSTSRLTVRYHTRETQADLLELEFRPAYHDFRDPSAAFDDKASIELGVIGIARDMRNDEAFLRRLTLVSIESIEPRAEFFRPISWHTNLLWERASSDARHELTFNVGAGVAYQSHARAPIVFALGESDLVDSPGLDKRRQLRLGLGLGTHWEPLPGLRTGLELDYRQALNADDNLATAEAWLGIALHEQLSLNLQTRVHKGRQADSLTQTSVGLRFYF